ncbi:UNVERIFIED_CONTAM: hypothetical protein FKN15_054389 [Acipenser sinensis]
MDCACSAHRYHPSADSKRVPSADRFFHTAKLTMQPPKSYSVGGQRCSQAAYRQARRRPARLQGSLVRVWRMCCAVLCCAVLCCAVLCCAVLCCAVLCCAVLCCAVLCCAVLCCAVLCCGYSSEGDCPA